MNAAGFIKRSCSVLLMLFFAGRSFALNGFSCFGVNEGLSQSTIVDMFQDSKGRLWTSTADGLNWFDGREFHVFHNREKVRERLPSNYFSGPMYEDKSGRLWSGSRSGICYFNPDSGVFHSVVLSPEINSGKPWECRMIGVDNKGTLYFHSSRSEIAAIDPGQLTPRIVLKFPPSDPIYRSFFVSDTEFALVFENHLVLVSTVDFKQRNVNLPFGTGGNITEIRAFKDIIYLAGKKGCWKWNLSDDSFTGIFSSAVCEGAAVAAIEVDDQFLYVGTASCGIYRVDLADGRIVEHYESNTANPNALPLGSIKTLLLDEMGNLWSGVEGAGICLYDLHRKPFRLFRNGMTKGMKFPTDYVKSVMVRNNDEIWLGTYEGGLIIYNRQKDESRIYDRVNTSGKFPGNSISDIHCDAKGRIWLAFPSGVFLTDETVSRGKKIPIDWSGSGEMNCRQLISLHDGRMVLASDWGLYALNEKKMIFESIENKVSAHAAFEDSENSIWVGGYYGYLYRFKWVENSTGYSLVITDSLFEGFNARDFEENRKQGSIYMATEKGILIYELASGKSRLLNGDDGLSNEFIYSLFFDRNDLLWATSNKGLMSIDLENGEIIDYDIDDGLQAMEFNTRALFRLENGEVFLGGVSGLNSFFPEQVKKNRRVPKAFLTELKINDQTFPLNYLMNSKPIVLSYQMNGLSFSYANSDYSGIKKSRTAFFLEGNDEKWTITPAQSSFRLESLRPGLYTLRLKAMNADGIWGPEVEVCRFIIATPYWLSWWFIGLIILCAVAISAVIVIAVLRSKYRKQLQVLEHQKRIQNLRLQISRDIHDDIGSGLSRIALMGQLHERNQDGSYMQKISDTAREMTSQLSQIVWSLNPDNDDIPAIILYLSDLAYRFFEGTSTEVHFVDGTGSRGFKLDPRQRVYLVKCYRESLNNALKYASARNISIDILHDGYQMTVTISDDGEGFSEGTVKGGGNGLRIMEKRMTEIGGSFEIRSTPGIGTTVTLNFPITTKV